MLLFRLSLFVLLISVLWSVNGDKQFRLGRSKGGNLGAPADYSDQNTPPAQWFEQKLDHSSFTDLRTWKQVCF